MRLWWVGIVACAGCGVLSGLDGLGVEDGAAPDVTSIDANDDVANETSVVDVGLDVGPARAGRAARRADSCPCSSRAITTRRAPRERASSIRSSILRRHERVHLHVQLRAELRAAAEHVLVRRERVHDAADRGNALEQVRRDQRQLGKRLSFADGPVPADERVHERREGAGPADLDGRAHLHPVRLLRVRARARLRGLLGGVGRREVSVAHDDEARRRQRREPRVRRVHHVHVDRDVQGTLQLYGDSLCSMPTGSLTVDGTCQAFNNGNLKSVKYTPAVDQGTCTPGTSTASIAVSGQTTICCP